MIDDCFRTSPHYSPFQRKALFNHVLGSAGSAVATGIGGKGVTAREWIDSELYPYPVIFGYEK